MKSTLGIILSGVFGMVATLSVAAPATDKKVAAEQVTELPEPPAAKTTDPQPDNALFDIPEPPDGPEFPPVPTPEMQALIEQMLNENGPGELPDPDAPLLREGTLDEAKLIELGRKVVGSVVVIQSYDDEGTRIGRTAGFFVDANGMIATDPAVLGNPEDPIPAYLTVITGDGRSYRIIGIAGSHGSTGSLFLQSDAAGTVPLPIEASPVVQTGEEAAVIGYTEERGLILADATARPSANTGDGTPWLKVSGQHSAGIAGSPVIDRSGRVRGIVALEFSLGGWTNYALPVVGFTEVVGKAREANLAPLVRASVFRPAKESVKDSSLFAAATALQEKRYARAARILAAMAAEQPRNASVWALYGLTARRLGAHAESAEAFRKAAALRPDSGSAWYNLALSELLHETGGGAPTQDPKQTLAALEKATEAGANDKAAWLLLGQSALKANDYARAARAFIRVVELESDYADGFYFLGVAQAKSGNLLAAQSALSRCLKLSPRHDRGWFLLGLVYTKAKNLSDAASAFEKCLESNPRHPQAARNLSHVYLKQGRKTEARAVHDAARKRLN